jgi:hypothetical protein
MSLLGVSRDAKTRKGEKDGYLTGILYLAPSTFAGFGNMCANASKGCKAACLFTAGRGAMSNVQQARVNKTERFVKDRVAFMDEIVKDIKSLVRKAEKEGMVPAVRLNGTSDIPWENVKVGDKPNIFAVFPDVQFYDYTKSPGRINLPGNYDLTFSLAEDNDINAKKALESGINVAAVFNELPSSFMGKPVINGDETDLRFNDPKGVIVGLKAKGLARKDSSGFVR